MKNMFKLAAIAVSMALVASLAACSSGDDDVVDASTPKYLVKDQIGKYVDSITYYQNVSDDEIKSLKKAHEAVMEMLGDCADCLADYFENLKNVDVAESYEWTDEFGVTHKVVEKRATLYSQNIASAIRRLEDLKSYETEKAYHKVYVYKPAIGRALVAVHNARQKVYNIGEDDGTKIVDKKLNERQAANMKTYTDAVAALTAALNEEDSKKGERLSIKAANTVIETFGKLENKNVDRAEILKVIVAVDAMYDDIEENVYDKIIAKPFVTK